MDEICRILSTCTKDILFVDGDNFPDCIVNFDQCVIDGITDFPFQIFFFMALESKFRRADKLSRYPWFVQVKSATSCSQSADCNMIMAATAGIFLARNSNIYLLSRDKIFSEAAIRLREMNMCAREISVITPLGFIDFLRSYIPSYQVRIEEKGHAVRLLPAECFEKCSHCDTTDHGTCVCPNLNKYQRFLLYLKYNYEPKSIIITSQLGFDFTRSPMYNEKDDFKTLKNQAILDSYLMLNPANNYQLILQDSILNV